VPSKLTGMSLRTSPAGSGWRARSPVAYLAADLPAVLVLGEHERERDVGMVVAVGINVDPVDRAGSKTPGRSPGPGSAAGRWSGSNP
jgi:hypothetical protein